MAIDFSPENSERRRGLRLPNPPPLLHTRSGNDPVDRPSTPRGNNASRNGFTSPLHTPQGSPSKNHIPPGAIDLPNVFDKALKLNPSSPTKPTLNHHSSYTSPTKSSTLSVPDDPNFNESVIHQPAGNPNVRSKENKENRPPSPVRLNKDLGLNSNAAVSRREPYKPREETIHRRQVHLRGLTTEELEKAQNPGVKRLVNVTQLCMYIFPFLV